MATDETILQQLQKLVDEEHALWSGKAFEKQTNERLEQLKVELDQCWDLLRQRRAIREFGGDPDQAETRPPEVVEKYEQ
jgi:hypothetical protein